MALPDYYSVLNIPKDANLNDIKKAFRVEVAKYHPDVNNSPNASTQFKLIVEAYEVLSNETNRAEYNKLISAQKHSLPTVNESPKQKEWKETSEKKSKKYADTNLEDLLLLEVFLVGDILGELLDNSGSIIDSASDAIDGVFDLF